METNAWGSAPSPYCGRVDDHEPHTHHTHEALRWQQTQLECPGKPSIEGGAP